MNSLDLFKTPSNLPFLHYVVHPIVREDQTFPQISLTLDVMPIVEQPSLDDLWTTVDNPTIQRAREHELGRMFAANVISNRVAGRSRRAAANILIVPNAAEKAWFEQTCIEKVGRSPWTIVVDASLAPNEIRATYWKIMYEKERIDGEVVTTDTPVAVDGGLQFSPEGFSCIQKQDNELCDYHAYFARGFV